MSDSSHERFDLDRFVLDFLEQQGSLVAPPAFGVYEVLMPEELAAHLGVDEFQHLRFGTGDRPAETEPVLDLGVNHPLVETIAEQVATEPANAVVYINKVRLEKRGLVELARKTLGFPNARLDFVPKTQEQGELHHYLRLNFKVTIVGEEKQEELASVVMDVQAGHAVSDPALLHQLSIYDNEPGYEGFPVAAPRWIGAGAALAADTLHALLPRAELALRAGMTERLAGLAARIQHHLDLDLARIEEYYDDLANDLRRRKARLDAADIARRQDIDAKLAILETERGTKAADVRGRYGLRVELELVNTLIITQPKVTVPVSISNRTTTIQRTAVWDPLMHQLEPLVCDVCGQPGKGLHLCTRGHLAHSDCLAPQCIDCKRVYCQLCDGELATCAVCQQPVCRHSLIICPTCGRGTCREHQSLCHAADGQPATLVVAPPAPSKPPVQAIAPLPEKPAAKSPPPARHDQVKPLPRKSAPATTKRAAPVAKGVRIDVQVYEDSPVVVAFVMRSTKRVLATRTIELTPRGIVVSCSCEKSPCPESGYYHRPAPASHIAAQVGELLHKLQREYLVPGKKVHYLHMRGQLVRETDTLVLPPVWRDAEGLAEAMRGFDRLR